MPDSSNATAISPSRSGSSKTGNRSSESYSCRTRILCFSPPRIQARSAPSTADRRNGSRCQASVICPASPWPLHAITTASVCRGSSTNFASPGRSAAVRSGSRSASSPREADLYIHLSPRTKQWDTCAPEIILEEAGGRLTDIFGREIKYNTRDIQNHNGILASNGALHTKSVERLKPRRPPPGRRAPPRPPRPPPPQTPPPPETAPRPIRPTTVSPRMTRISRKHILKVQGLVVRRAARKA
ncbi:MAG: hypothetical protein IPK58_16745 [Acidobacteria bacterium]|nr:hypothetical protein [Acidobacteriota bacterium]